MADPCTPAPFAGIQVSRFASRPRAEAARHRHAVLSLCTQGSVVFEQRSRMRVEVGDVLVVPAGEPHRSVEADGAEHWGLCLCPTCCALPAPVATLFERVRGGAPGAIRLPAERHAFMFGLWDELARESASAQPSRDVVQSLLTLIFADVTRAADVGAPLPAVVADALAFIERRCLEGISARDVAAAVRRSPAHLTTAVRQATGRTLGAWITAGRLAEARRRLQAGDEAIETIADRVGYADATHFIRVFRREHGVTPAAWRASRS